MATAVRDVVELMPTNGLEEFGQDPDGPLPSDVDADCCAVVVTSPPCPLSDADHSRLMDTFNPLSVCDDYGIGLYIGARAFVHFHSN